MLVGKIMKIRNNRTPWRTFCIPFCISVIILFILIICSNAAHAGERLTVSATKANVRSGPGTNYSTLWQVNKYYPIKVIKKVGSWFLFVDFEGDKGWMYSTLVRKIPSVITIKENCNIRSGPGTTYNVVFRTEKGVAFKVIKRKGSWINVQHEDGDKGWIHKALVW